MTITRKVGIEGQKENNRDERVWRSTQRLMTGEAMGRTTREWGSERERARRGEVKAETDGQDAGRKQSSITARAEPKGQPGSWREGLRPPAVVGQSPAIIPLRFLLSPSIIFDYEYSTFPQHGGRCHAQQPNRPARNIGQNLPRGNFHSVTDPRILLPRPVGRDQHQRAANPLSSPFGASAFCLFGPPGDRSSDVVAHPRHIGGPTPNRVRNIAINTNCITRATAIVALPLLI